MDHKFELLTGRMERF